MKYYIYNNDQRRNFKEDTIIPVGALVGLNVGRTVGFLDGCFVGTFEIIKIRIKNHNIMRSILLVKNT